MASCKEQTIEVRGRKVRLYRGGEGPQLLFLHDPFCPTWLPLHEHLAAYYEVFVPLHPGFLGSEDGFDQFETMEDLIFHYLDLCAVLRLERPALAGASFGGWIAAEWAMRYSEALKSVILIDALGLRLAEAPAADLFGLDPATLRQTMFSNPAATLAMETIPETPRAEAIVSTILARRTLARFAWQFPDNPRLRGYLYRVQVPTMILWGEHDGVVPVAHGRAYHQGIAKSQLVTMANVGHLPHVEAPAACAEILGNFLGGLGASGG
ncbi:MAG: alpha/beta hydrolase [Candidatus Binatia bacterium]